MLLVHCVSLDSFQCFNPKIIGMPDQGHHQLYSPTQALLGLCHVFLPQEHLLNGADTSVCV